MKTQLLVAFCLSALCRFSAAQDFETGSSFQQDDQNRLDTCKGLVNHQDCENGPSSANPSPSDSSSSSSDDSDDSSESVTPGAGSSGSGSGAGVETSTSASEGSGSGDSGEGGSSGEWQEGEYCFLLKVLLNYSIAIEGSAQEIFVEWINETQINIVENSSYTEYEMLVTIYFELQALFVEYPEIAAVIEYTTVGNWGMVCDLEALAIDIQTQFTEVSPEECVDQSGSGSSNSSGGSCPLTEALQSECDSSSGAQQQAIQELIVEIEAAINSSSSFEEVMVAIYEAWQSWSVQYSAYVSVVESVQVQGFGTVESFVAISATYWRINNFQVAVGGDDADCAIIQALIALSQNSCYTESQQLSFKQFEGVIETYFNSTEDVQLRVQYFVEQLYQQLILTPWNAYALYNIEIVGFGTVYELMYAYIYEMECGISPLPSEATTTAAAESSTAAAASSSAAASTTASSASSSSSAPTGDCSTVEEVNVFTVSTNTSVLLTSIHDAEQSWSSAEVGQFQPYQNRIYTLTTNSSASADDIFEGIKTVFTQCAPSGSTLNVLVMAIVIEGWGTVQEYCQCA